MWLECDYNFKEKWLLKEVKYFESKLLLTMNDVIQFVMLYYSCKKPLWKHYLYMGSLFDKSIKSHESNSTVFLLCFIKANKDIWC